MLKVSGHSVAVANAARLGYELIPVSDDVDRTAGSIVGPSDCESLLFADLDSSKRSVHLAVPSKIGRASCRERV